MSQLNSGKSTNAIKGMIIGISAGKYFGPVGIVAGGIIGGVAGACLGIED